MQRVSGLYQNSSHTFREYLQKPQSSNGASLILVCFATRTPHSGILDMSIIICDQ